MVVNFCQKRVWFDLIICSILQQLIGMFTYYGSRYKLTKRKCFRQMDSAFDESYNQKHKSGGNVKII